MNMHIEKSGTGIRKSGTGIHRSGTGIHRSGTGIRKSGTGMRVPSFVIALAVFALAFCAPVLAAEPDILVSERNDNLMISLHTDEGMFTGAVPLSAGQAGYFQVALHQIAETTDQGMVFSPLVKASGSGNAGESVGDIGGSTLVKASGSGNSGESVDERGGSLLVKASGSGNSGESLCNDAGLLVKASGSGNSGESVDAPGGSLLVKASGSGNSGEAAKGCNVSFDLLAELVIDRSGSHIVVHDLSGNELLVAYVAATSSGTPVGDQPITAREFVAAP